MKKPWLTYALITTGFWGVWGAFAEFPTRHGFPETLVYVVWALTMIPPALYAMQRAGWRVLRDPKSMLLGSLIGFTGAGGQMLLFHAVHTGPTYLIFPIIALSPVITIALSMLFLKERVSKVGALGVVLALIALPLFNYSPGDAGAVLSDAANPSAASAGASGLQGVTWFVYALVILFAWGVQAYFMKLANGTMDAENIFLYMTLTGLAADPGGAVDDRLRGPHRVWVAGTWPRRDHADLERRGRVDAGVCLPLWQGAGGGAARQRGRADDHGDRFDDRARCHAECRSPSAPSRWLLSPRRCSPSNRKRS